MVSINTLTYQWISKLKQMEKKSNVLWLKQKLMVTHFLLIYISTYSFVEVTCISNRSDVAAYQVYQTYQARQWWNCTVQNAWMFILREM